MADFPTSMNCDCINKVSTGLMAYFESICQSISEESKKVKTTTTTTQTTSSLKGCIQLYPATQSDLSDSESESESEVSDSEIYAMLEKSFMEAHERNNGANASVKENGANASTHDTAEESDDVQEENDNVEMVDNDDLVEELDPMTKLKNLWLRYRTQEDPADADEVL